ncbi:formate dehydrogenase subunit delta [Propionibacteriaceae bacterium Y2011]
MATDIARAQAHLPSDRASAAISTHVRRFWDPRMRAALIAHLHAGDLTDPVLVSAVEQLAAEQGPPGCPRPQP